MEFSKKWLICSALVSLALIIACAGKNWDALVKIALTALVTGVIGWVLGKIL